MRIDEMLGLLRQRWGSSSFRLFELELLFWVVVVLLTLALVRYQPVLFEKAEIWLESNLRVTRTGSSGLNTQRRRIFASARTNGSLQLSRATVHGGQHGPPGSPAVQRRSASRHHHRSQNHR